MIRLDHEGHEVSRDPEFDARGPYDGGTRFTVPNPRTAGKQTAGGYWERLQQEMNGDSASRRCSCGVDHCQDL